MKKIKEHLDDSWMALTSLSPIIIEAKLLASWTYSTEHTVAQQSDDQHEKRRNKGQ